MPPKLISLTCVSSSSSSSPSPYGRLFYLGTNFSKECCLFWLEFVLAILAMFVCVTACSSCICVLITLQFFFWRVDIIVLQIRFYIGLGSITATVRFIACLNKTCSITALWCLTSAWVWGNYVVKVFVKFGFELHDIVIRFIFSTFFNTSFLANFTAMFRLVDKF
jgi:hypothetical protein